MVTDIESDIDNSQNGLCIKRNGSSSALVYNTAVVKDIGLEWEITAMTLTKLDVSSRAFPYKKES
jgi:hypothetical protein